MTFGLTDLHKVDVVEHIDHNNKIELFVWCSRIRETVDMENPLTLRMKTISKMPINKKW